MRRRRQEAPKKDDEDGVHENSVTCRDTSSKYMVIIDDCVRVLDGIDNAVVVDRNDDDDDDRPSMTLVDVVHRRSKKIPKLTEALLDGLVGILILLGVFLK